MRDKDQLTGRILKIFSPYRIKAEVYQDLGIGEVIRFCAWQGQISQKQPQQHLITGLENEQEKSIYKASPGDIILANLVILAKPIVLVKPPISSYNNHLPNSVRPLQIGDGFERLQPGFCLKIEAKVMPEDICFLNGIIEGYDGLAVLRTINGSQGLVEILASPSYQEEISELTHSLPREMPFQIIREEWIEAGCFE